MSTVDLDAHAPMVDWPLTVDDAPPGWHWGRHVNLGSRGSGYFLIRDDDDATIIARQRPDIDEDDVPSDLELAAAARAWGRGTAWEHDHDQ